MIFRLTQGYNNLGEVTVKLQSDKYETEKDFLFEDYRKR